MVIKPELEFVECGARTRFTPDHVERLRALVRQPLDWRIVLEHAAFHGVLSLLGRNLSTLPDGSVPDEVLAVVQSRMHANATGNLLKLAELVRVVGLLAERGIESVHFKGAVLAVQAFGNVAMREFADLDVLVHEGDVRAAREILLANGYRSRLDADAEELHLRTSYWLAFVHDDGLRKIDLHWRLADPFFRYEPDLPSLWRNVQSVTVGGVPVKTFGPQDTVLVLAAHGFKHAYSRLKWVCDLAEWIRSQPGLDWDGIRETARELRVARILAVSLMLVHRHDDTILPPQVVGAVADDRRANVLAERIRSVMLAAAPEMSGWTADLFQARGREHARDALGYLWYQCARRVRTAVVPNERDRAMVSLPRYLGFLYWGLRPLRLCRKALERDDTADRRVDPH